MKSSSISWTDYSGGAANIVLRGSTAGDCECSPGCANCYMLALHNRFGCLPERTAFYPEKLARLAKTRFPEWSPKRGEGHRPMVFVADGGDIFHEDVPDGFIANAFAVMLGRYTVTWQVLTKRAQRMHDLLNDRSFWKLVHGYADRAWQPVYVYPADYLWLGVTVENQQAADERIPLLLKTPAAVRWISAEPLLGPVDLTAIECDRLLAMFTWKGRINWVVAGAESGPNRRPFDVQWAVGLYEQCRAAGVPYFFKQSGALKPGQGAELPGYGVVQQWPEGVMT